ncbi:TPA: alpha/beta hydrolase [Legionella pneumophila]|nr:alpha/beta hydrolase [Legionella pneumophila]
MNQIKWIALLFCLIVSNVFAEKLEITVEQKKVILPYWLSKPVSYGAVIIVRGGETAQWSLLLEQFAKGLFQNGWSVVLLNCTKNNSILWINQLPEVISTLRQNDNKRIVLVHYGDQLNLSLEYFSKLQSKMINGLVMLSAYDLNKNLQKAPRLRFPLFDIVGQFDYDMVKQQRKSREERFKENSYLAIDIPGAPHDYQYSQQLLLAFVHGWMAKLPEFEPQPPPILVSYLEPVYSSASLILSIDELDYQPLVSQINS